MEFRLSCMKPDFCVLVPSVLAFFLAFLPVPMLEAIYGPYIIFGQAWIMIAIAFHEIGHIFFAFLVSPVFALVPQLSFLAEPLHYLGGFLFNAIVAVVLLPFSLSLQARVSSGKLPGRSRPMVFSFMFIAYLNLLMLPYTLTHLRHVVGPGLDFTMASFLLAVTLEQLLALLWAVAVMAIALAAIANFLFAFRQNAKRRETVKFK